MQKDIVAFIVIKKMNALTLATIDRINAVVFGYKAVNDNVN